jgi:hypothetical protein
MQRFALAGAAISAALMLIAVLASSALALPTFLPGGGVTIEGTSGKGVLQIEGGGTIKCEKDVPLGEITTETTVNVDIHFEGCKAIGFAANSFTDKAKPGVILAKGVGTLCYISKPAKRVGLSVEITPTLQIEVPTAKQTIEIKGTIIGEVVSPINTLSFSGSVVFTQSAGKPGIEKCEGTPAAVLLAKEATKAYKPAGEETTESLKFSSGVEVMA